MIQKLLSCFLMIHYVYCADWEPIMSYSAPIPSNVQMLNLAVGQRLEVAVRW